MIMLRISRQTATKDHVSPRTTTDVTEQAPQPGGAWAAAAAAVAVTERAAAEAVAKVAAALLALSSATPPTGATSRTRPAPTPLVPVIDRTPRRPAVDDGSVLHAAALDALEEGVRTQWSSTLADPVLPWFAPEPAAQEQVSFAAPGEQGLWRDISLVSRAAAAVRASEARFAAAFDRAPTPLLIAAAVAGRPGRVLCANAAMGRLLGRDPAELLDMSVPDLVVPDLLALELSVQELAALDGFVPGGAAAEPAAVLCHWRHEDGHSVAVRVRMAAGNGSDEVVLHVDPVLSAIPRS